jgi:hypothetical protein
MKTGPFETSRPGLQVRCGAREHLEREADLVRARLLGTIGELDRRRHELLDLKLQIRRHAGDLLSILGGLMMGVGSTAAILVLRERRRERRVRQERFRAAARLWRHPERIAAKRSALRTALRMALVAFAAVATTTVGTRQIERLRRRPRIPAHPKELLGV